MKAVLFGYQKNIDLQEDTILEGAIKKALSSRNDKKIFIFLSNNEIAQKIAEKFNNTTNIEKIKITTDLESDHDFLEVLQKRDIRIILIFENGSDFSKSLKIQKNHIENTECTFPQVGIVKIVKLRKSS